MTYCLEIDGPILTPVDIAWLRRLKAFGPKSSQEIPIGTISRLKIAQFICAEAAEADKSAIYGAKNWSRIQYRIDPKGEDFLASLNTDEPGDHE